MEAKKDLKDPHNPITLSESQIDELRETFDLYDKDSSGSISVGELKQAMISLGQNLTNEQIIKIIKECDDNNDGEIDFPEFVLLMCKSVSFVNSEAELKEAFKIFDEDGNGKISLAEFRKAMKYKLPDEELKMMLEFGDGNEIDYEEFVKMIMFK